MNNPRIIVPLDFPDEKTTLNLVEKLEPELCRLKVGKELFTSCGPALVEKLIDHGFEIFLDLKFHDIPNTVAGACAAAARLGVWMLNVHASGGKEMMMAAREAINSQSHQPLLIGVTVLTSMSSEELSSIGIDSNAIDQVIRLARLSKNSGMDGVVCSAQEVKSIRNEIGRDFVLVTPGIRPAGSDKGDQKRVMTPNESIKAGSDYLVIGRPITLADDPLQALIAVEEEVNKALKL